MSDLAGFLLARIAEDEEVARATSGRGRRWVRGVSDEGESPAILVTSKPGENVVWFVVDPGDAVDGGVGPADADHIARWDPARVLAECDAKRRIVELMRGSYSKNDVEYWALDDALRLLALPYADHPDYREEWRP